MIDRKIGYIICETASSAEPNGTIISEDSRGRVVIETILQDMDVKNRNGRFYAVNELSPQVKSKRLQELLNSGNLYSENGHPMSKDIARQQTIDPNNRACKILKLWIDGKDIKAHVKGAQGSIGQEFNDDILDGSKPSFSLRALGTVKNTNRGAEVENITIITWDRVIYPSHERAYMTNIVNVSESANAGSPYGNKLIMDKTDSGLLVPITNQSVIDYIKTESCNIKSIMESFDVLYNDITLLESGNQVQLTDKQGSIFVINLESHIQNEIMNYAYNRF